jgi:hypothetical protein
LKKRRWSKSEKEEERWSEEKVERGKGRLAMNEVVGKR